jgi:hypothetical protein
MTGEGIQSAKRATAPRPRRLRFLLLAFSAAAFLAACGMSAHAQTNPMGVDAPVGGVHSYPQENGPMMTSGDGDGVESVEAERRLNALNAEREKALISDTAKLLKLAIALNEQIGKSNPGQLTPEQLRMVAEMEKLAHSVREKMAMSLRGPQYPGMDAPMPFPQGRPH